MSGSRRRLLFIIFYLSLKIKAIIDDTNKVIEQIEVEANNKLEELLRKQVELNQQEIDNYYNNAQMLWQEYSRVNNENDKLKREIERLNKELKY